MTRTVHDVLVLGGGYAGVLCANRLAGQLGAKARVTLVTERADFIHRVRLHEAIAGRPFPRRTLRELLSKGVTLRIGRVRSVSLAARALPLTISARSAVVMVMVIS